MSTLFIKKSSLLPKHLFDKQLHMESDFFYFIFQNPFVKLVLHKSLIPFVILKQKTKRKSGTVDRKETNKQTHTTSKGGLHRSALFTFKSAICACTSTLELGLLKVALYAFITPYSRFCSRNPCVTNRRYPFYNIRVPTF